MNKQELLRIEINLLLLKYGEQAILKTLAQQLNVHPEILELDIRKSLASPRTSPQGTAKKTKPFDIESIINEQPENRELLIQLNDKYENRTFLPELRDVKRFFDKHHRPTSSLKSRGTAQTPLFRLLAALDKSELKRLLSNPITHNTQSSLGLISDQILGRNKNTHQEKK